MTWVSRQLWLLVGILASAAFALVGFSFHRARLLLRPVRIPYKHLPADVMLEMEEVRIPSPRGMLAAWYLPANNGSTLVCCHGINDTRAQWVEQIALLHRRSGYGAVLFDLAGHGTSEGNLVTYGARETQDVAAVLHYLRSRGDVDMTRIGILGYSLGAITAVLSAARMPELHCVVIESCFADLQREVAVLFSRYTGLPAFPFASLIVFFAQLTSRARLGEIRPARVIGDISPRAVMIISDLCDSIFNEPYDGEELYANAGEPKELWQVAECDHVQAFAMAPDEWIERVGSFLDRHLLGESVSIRDGSQTLEGERS
jgi:pimeloyl-ACP methyl ester carboxylesterase